MNLPKSPLWTDQRFWFFLIGMVVVSLAQYLYFRIKKWV
jgi:Mg2+ and Co2+ transporter CorA